MGRNVEIEIVEQSDGTITLSNPKAKVRQGQEVEWISSPETHFVVHFSTPGRQPFRKSYFHKKYLTGVPRTGSGDTPYPYEVHVRENHTTGVVIIGENDSTQDAGNRDWRED